MLPQPLEAILPHLLNDAHVDVAVAVMHMRQEGERGLVLAVPVAGDLDKGGGGWKGGVCGGEGRGYC